MVLNLVQELFPWVEDAVHNRKGNPIFPEEIDGVLEKMYLDECLYQLMMKFTRIICIHMQV